MKNTHGNIASPNPSYPQPIEVVTGTQEVKVENKNLLVLDFDTASEYVTINSDDSFSINNTSASTKYPTIKNIPLEAGTYTMLFTKDSYIGNIFIQRNNDNAYNFYLNADNKYRVFTFTEAGVVKFQTNIPANTQTGTIKMMLLKGSYTFDNQPTYTPHQEQNYTISLGNIELCKIGNYQDYLYKSNDKWYKKGYIGKTTLDNTKTYSYSTYFGAIIWSDNSIKDMASNTEIGAISNKALGMSPLSLLSNNGIAQNNSSNRILVKFEGVSSYNTDELAKQYFNSNPYIVYYALATPTDTEITDTNLINQLNNIEKAQSYNGVTNISSNGNLPFIVSASALKGSE